jgi:hypothetical protein
MRQFAAALLSCAMFSVVLLAGPTSEAHAQGYDVSGQAVVDDARSYIRHALWSLRLRLLRVHFCGVRRPRRLFARLA